MPIRLTRSLLRSATQLVRLQQRAWARGLKALTPVSAATSESRKRPATPGVATPTPASGRWQTRKRFLAAPGFSLSYCLYTPESAPEPPAGPRPLVVMLHGCKLTAEEFAQGTGMNQLAASQGFVVLYPQQAVARNSSRCWRWFRPDPRRGLAEADAIAALIGKLLAEGLCDARRVYVAGLSAGAGMAGLLALRHPQLLAALSLHSGPVLGAANSALGGVRTMRRGATVDPAALLAKLRAPGAPNRGMPVQLLHGQQDRTVVPRNQQQLAEQFAHLNQLELNPTPPVRQVDAGTAREHHITQYRRDGRVWLERIDIPALGHAWSGGDASVPYHATQGPSASTLAWCFFRHHQRDLPNP